MSVEKFNILKKRFLLLQPEQRRVLTESLHKFNLGVESKTDITALTHFLGFDATGLNPKYAEELIHFLLATSNDSHIPVANESRDDFLENSDSVLAPFQQDETDTLIEDVKPFK